MNEKLIKAGSRILLMEHVESIDKLVGAYSLEWNVDTGAVWLEETNKMQKPSKVYDFDQKLRQMVIKKYRNSKTNIGVLLAGLKGQGKTFTAKMICEEIGLPVITITKSIPKEIDFVSFLAKIPGEFVLFVDEFEKLFALTKSDNPYHVQDAFLSFMDGKIIVGRILFILTCNEEVSKYLINRPSRITFYKEYTTMPEELFDLIVDDLLNNKEHKKDLCDNVSLINLNVDLLISIVKDMNLFEVPFSDFSNLYNYKMEMFKYDVYVKHPEQTEKWEKIYRSNSAFTYNTSWFAGYTIEDVIQGKDGEFTFISSEWNEEKEESVKIQVRIVPFTTLTTITNAYS